MKFEVKSSDSSIQTVKNPNFEIISKLKVLLLINNIAMLNEITSKVENVVGIRP